MAHWAEIDENSIVARVLVTDNNDSNGDEGYQWLIDNFGGTWVKTSYNTLGGVHYLPDDQCDENGNRIPSGLPNVRYNYAGVGFLYDPIKDAFIPPKPSVPEELSSGYEFVFNETTCLWELSPVGL
jgi:hypothetical protein